MLKGIQADSRIFIVDDDEAHCLLIEETLRHVGYTHFNVIADSREAVTAFQEFGPDVVLLDLGIPGPDGLEILRQLGLCIPPDTYLPIVVMTADQSQSARQLALSLGASDFITKPFDRTEVVLRVGAVLRTRFLHREIEAHAQVEILHRLALAAEYRDDSTGRHTHRVGELAALLSLSLNLSEQEVERIRVAAPLHDIGKIAMPDRILLKPGRLTTEEYELIKTHAAIGGLMLSGSRFPILHLAEKIAMYHHERWDGTGYRGLESEAIPIEARIVSIADTFDVLVHVRPYKQAWPVCDALSEIRLQGGRQFDPHLVKAFIELLRSEGLKLLSEAVEHPRLPGLGKHSAQRDELPLRAPKFGRAGEPLIRQITP